MSLRVRTSTVSDEAKLQKFLRLPNKISIIFQIFLTPVKLLCKSERLKEAFEV
jgi:hypothetical protein